MFDFEKISASKFYVAPTSERVVEFSPTDIDMSNVARILSLAVDAKASSVDAQDGYAQVSGRVNFRLAYLDKEGMPKGVDYNADFTARVDGEFAEGDSAWSDVVISESDAAASDTLTLTAVLEVTVSAIKRDEIEVLTGADDCYVQKKEIYVPTFIAQNPSSFRLTTKRTWAVRSSRCSDCPRRSCRSNRSQPTAAQTLLLPFTQL